jgi:hypothetical protein
MACFNIHMMDSLHMGYFITCILVVVANDLIQSLHHVVTELTNVSRRTSLVALGLEIHCCVYREYADRSRWLDCRFSDNNFALLPWAPKTITFTSAAPFSLADLRGSLSVMSVADTYPPAIAVLQPPPVEIYDINTLNWIQASLYLSLPFECFPSCRFPSVSRGRMPDRLCSLKWCLPYRYTIPVQLELSSECQYSLYCTDNSAVIYCSMHIAQGWCTSAWFCWRVCQRFVVCMWGGTWNMYLWVLVWCALQGLFLGAHPGMDPLALTKSAGIVPRVSSCSGNPNPCATNSTSA